MVRTANTYMEEAENILGRCVQQNPSLALWRCFWPIEYDEEGRSADTLLVGMPDENSPNKPSELIVLSTHLDLDGQRVEIKTEYITRWPMFKVGGDPIKYLEEEAEALSSL